MVVGYVIEAGGVAMTIGGVVLAINESFSSWQLAFEGGPHTSTGPAIALIGGGVILAIVGLALAADGSYFTPADPQSPHAVTPSWVGEPGGKGWTWRF